VTACRDADANAPLPNASFFPASIRTKRLTEENKDNEEVFKIIGKKSSFPSLSSVKVF
jgi:hypothetical protein